MREPHHLNKAPIREALIDIFIEVPKAVEQSDQLALLQSLRDQVSEAFPKVHTIAQGEIHVDFEQKKGQVKDDVLGYRCLNADGNRGVQFRRDGFTFNWLRPYSEWAELRESSSEMWKLYCRVMNPTKITKLGLRYINDLAFPSSFDSFGEYLVSDPIIPEGLPQAVSQFLTRVTFDDDESNASATITHAFEGVTNPDFVNVILDIETRIQSEFEPADPQIWLRLDHLRNLKNRIFFRSLTEKAVELFA